MFEFTVSSWLHYPHANFTQDKFSVSKFFLFILYVSFATPKCIFNLSTDGFWPKQALKWITWVPFGPMPKPLNADRFSCTVFYTVTLCWKICRQLKGYCGRLIFYLRLFCLLLSRSEINCFEVLTFCDGKFSIDDNFLTVCVGKKCFG